jgi:hypothetical protein
MRRPSRFANAGMLALMVLTGINAACGEQAEADRRVADMIQAQDLAEAGNAKHDFHLLTRAACVREDAGDVASIDAERAPGKVLSNMEDDLSVYRLLMQAITLAPAGERAALETARDRALAGLPLGPALCGTQAQGLRGTGYIVRLTYDIKQTQTVNLPRLKPDEPVYVTVGADNFGLITFQLLGPDGAACNSQPPASRTVFCKLPSPGGGTAAGGYRVVLTNHSNLVTHIAVYVY